MSHTAMLQLLGLFSLVTFVGSLVAVPWLIGRMQPDYFVTHWHRVNDRHRRHPALAVAIWLARNGIGLCLLVAGIAMLFLPGQGLLTMLVAICMMDVPGKRRLLDRLIGYDSIQTALNWVRRKQGKEEFVFRNRDD
ncbi:PGPGW domain-containing protein [Desulfobulbus sp.]|uniref:PGPGW domain-containing protein n=1 Tax=Desulfobulbus sp. TaxID=895 RepID=UPI00286F23A6|nr:PGPGW domain-containing protein [Desulfobulbus sp.]